MSAWAPRRHEEAGSGVAALSSMLSERPDGMKRPDAPPGPRPPIRRRVVSRAVTGEPAYGGSPQTAAVPLIGGGTAGRPIPAYTQEAIPASAVDATLKAVSVWMPDDLRNRIDAAMPGVHRRSMVMVAYHRHGAAMYAEPVHRPGSPPPGSESHNWTVRLRRDEHGDIRTLAQHLGWPTSSVIRKLLELEVQ